MRKIGENRIHGDRIQRRLESLEKNQPWLAEKMGVSIEAVSKWIAGGGVEWKRLVNLSKVLECSLGYLIGEHEDERIAEVVRIMESLRPEGREQIRTSVIFAAAALPKLANGIANAA
jgi:transcriptional regulator with XRE-family HTH domain